MSLENAELAFCHAMTQDLEVKLEVLFDGLRELLDEVSSLRARIADLESGER